MEIYKDDIVNGVDPLPVRQGCHGPCACTGFCRVIIGHIDLKKYVDFMSTYVPWETFVENNMERDTKPKDERKIEYLKVEYGNSRPMPKIFAYQAMMAIGDNMNFDFYLELMEQPIIVNEAMISFVMKNREAFEKFIGIFEGKLEIIYNS